MFRQLEESKRDVPRGPKPLKRFTPPPDGVNQNYDQESEPGKKLSFEIFKDSCKWKLLFLEYSSDEYEEGEDEMEEEECEEEEDENPSKKNIDDDFLLIAQSAERAKKLRDKFEKWEQNEIKKEELTGKSINLCDGEVDDGQWETAKR